MYENIKIGIIGGDMRQAVLARRLSDIGFEVAVFGVSKSAKLGRAVRCIDYRSALLKSRVVILPLPVTHDGVYLNVSDGEKHLLHISQFVEKVMPESIIIGGGIPKDLSESLCRAKIKVIDVLKMEKMQIKNALPTAEGAVEIALHELPITLFGSKALVLGYGRIGKVLSSLLKNMGVEVYVSARSDTDIAYIEVNGYNSVKYDTDSFFSMLLETDVVFNTVPSLILDRETLKKLNQDAVIIDLASGVGGVDFVAAKEYQIKAVHALALPGKVAPITAGNILYECVLESLFKEGVIS